MHYSTKFQKYAYLELWIADNTEASILWFYSDSDVLAEFLLFHINV